MYISTTKLQNSFGKYLQLALDGTEIIVTKNGRSIASLSKLSGDMIKEENVKYESDQLIGYNQFIALTESSDSRFELIDGEMFLLASPRYEHQFTSMKLSHLFFKHFNKHTCHVMAAPLDITLTRNNVSEKSKKYKHVVQPDLMILCDTNNISKGKYLGTPELVIEILSPSTRSKDMIKKSDLYMNSGIKEYWIVDLEEQQIMVYAFENFELNSMKSFHIDQIISSTLYTDLSFPVKEIFN